MPEPEGPIHREGNRISVTGKLGSQDYPRFLASIHNTITKRAFKDLILDFSDCPAAFAPAMLAVCAQVLSLRHDGIDLQYVPPNKTTLARLFSNANWAHLLDPNNMEPSQFKGRTQVPAIHFTTGAEQHTAVNTIVDAVLSTISDLTRDDFAAIEWSLNELTDNVLTHSRCDVGGLVQMTTFERTRKKIEFVVSDAGIGVPRSLRETHPEMTSDSDALDRAIREGVTRDRSVGQGNGLFGSFQVCRQSKGYFQVHSGYAALDLNMRGIVHIRRMQIPFSGTLVVACIDCSQPGILQGALRLGGRTNVPRDFIESKYEHPEHDFAQFIMKNESSSFGSRVAGQPLRHRLVNVLSMCEGQKVVVDFDGIPLISSSFADEVFGKLFVTLGPVQFMHRVDFVNISDTVRSIIDLAIMQRSSTGL